MSEALRQAAENLRRWRANPASMVHELFATEPDLWQREILEIFPHKPRIAMKACKGPGKTALLTWLCWNFLLTRPHPKIAATSITKDNLDDNLWTEMAKWQHRSPLLQEAFTWTKTRIFAKDHPETWWMSARSWPKGGSKEQQADTLAGLHADFLMFIIDEAGGVPDAVMAAAEAGLANAMNGNEAHIVMAGNPTHLEGPLYRACSTEAALWFVREITGDPDDPKRSPRVSPEWARQQIQKYGRENPWVLVNVFGQFPPSSLNSLLGPDEVREAMGRHLREEQYAFAAKILGVDVARFGGDSSIIFPRQGLAAFVPDQLRNVDSTQGAGRVARKWADWDADACFIDDTGGFGAGWIDCLRTLGRQPIGVPFAGSPNDPRYYNKRAEIHFEMAAWVKNGGALPFDEELIAELTAPTYTFKGDKFLIEDKEQIRERIGRSPDKADALACTFAQPVVPKPRVWAPGGYVAKPAMAITDYDPFANA